jgi:hypothetical protein
VVDVEVKVSKFLNVLFSFDGIEDSSLSSSSSNISFSVEKTLSVQTKVDDVVEEKMNGRNKKNVNILRILRNDRIFMEVVEDVIVVSVGMLFADDGMLFVRVVLVVVGFETIIVGGTEEGINYRDDEIFPLYIFNFFHAKLPKSAFFPLFSCHSIVFLFT